MIITYDEAKRRSNMDKHFGLDFADLDMDFFEGSTIYPAAKAAWRRSVCSGSRSSLSRYSGRWDRRPFP